MKNRNRKWSKMKLEHLTVFVLLLHICKSDLLAESQDSEIASHKKDEPPAKDSRGLFQPRMDYEEWTPLGRGDPLKNDPTYDYVPPVLDRVHYWIDPVSRKSDSAQTNDPKKTEILVLGVSSKKPSTASAAAAADSSKKDIHEYLKYKEAQTSFNPHQRLPRPHPQIQAAYFPATYYKNKNQELPAFPAKPEQRVPYTVLVPPPIPAHMLPQQSAMSTTTPAPAPAGFLSTAPQNGLSIQEGKLVYHSTSMQDEWKKQQPSRVALQEVPIVKINSSAGGATSYHEHQSDFSSFQRMPPKRAPLTTQKLPPAAADKSMPTSMQQLLHQSMKTDVYSQEHLVKNLGTGIIVVPSDITVKNPEKMHKGHVTDDTMDIASTYVSIGKPDAKVQSPSGVEIQNVPILESPMMGVPPPPVPIAMNRKPGWMVNSHMDQYKPNPGPMQDFKRPIVEVSKYQQNFERPGTKLLQKATTPFLTSLLRKEITQSIPMPTIPSTTTTTTTPLPPVTTTASALTTDPLFKHYKQPAEPLKGPLYLIIQGHSKVKTYGPTKQIGGVPVQESNEIPSSEEIGKYPVKHLHDFKKSGGEERAGREGRSSRLQSLKHVVTTNLGAIDLSSVEQDDDIRPDKEVQETEFELKYDVSSREMTTEKYRKGIVESDELDRN